MEIDQILRERGTRYGTFAESALVAQNIDSWRDIEGYAKLIADRLVASRSTSED